jgi:hypothetical protein
MFPQTAIDQQPLVCDDGGHREYPRLADQDGQQDSAAYWSEGYPVPGHCVNIDTENAVDDGANLHLVVKVEVSSLAPEQNTTAADPVIRQNEWGAEVRLPVGKPTVIFSSDNLENKGRTEVELTATRIE